MATAGLGDDALDVHGLEVALVALATGPGEVLGVAETDRQLGEAGRPAGQEADDCQGDDCCTGGDLPRLGLCEHAAEHGERADRGGERGGHERGVALRQQHDQYDGEQQHGDAADEELEPSGALTRVLRKDAGARDERVRQRRDTECDGGTAVLVDPGPYAGESRQGERGHAGEDALQAVHVVPDRVREPEDEAEHDQQQRSGDQTGEAHQVVVPAAQVLLDRGGDRVHHVVVHGRRQRVGEGPQQQHLTVPDPVLEQ